MTYVFTTFGLSMCVVHVKVIHFMSVVFSLDGEVSPSVLWYSTTRQCVPSVAFGSNSP
jgi:hypothetical protein